MYDSNSSGKRKRENYSRGRKTRVARKKELSKSDLGEFQGGETLVQ